MPNSDINYANDDEISIGDLIRFFVNEWRAIASGAIIGLLLSTGIWVGFLPYKADAVLMNASASVTPSVQPQQIDAPISYVSWKYLLVALPELAGKMLAENAVKPEEKAQYERLSKQKWWASNVQPRFQLSKDDSKVLASVGKDMDGSAGSTILYFEMSDSAKNKDDSESELETSISFMRNGSLVWSLRNLVENIDNSSQRAQTELQKNIGAVEIELEYLQQKLRQLQSLGNRYPRHSDAAVRQLVDIKDGGQKYLPLDTQILAVETEILTTKESLARLRDKAIQQKTLRVLVERALPITGSQYDGVAAGQSLLKIIEEMREKLNRSNTVQLQALMEVEADLKSILVKFDRGLRVQMSPQASRSQSLVMVSALGLICGLLLMVAFLLIRSEWRKTGLTSKDDLG